MLYYASPLKVQSPSQQKNSIQENIEQRCLKLLRNSCSLAEIYRITGKSRCYLKRLAISHGVALNLKPRQLNNDFQQRIVRLARLGLHRRRITELCGIGIGSVEQVISCEAGLVEWRKRCRFESKRRRCRVQIQRYRQRYSDALGRNIKSDCNAAFFWLYTNDRVWLDRALPRPTRPCGPSRSV